MNPKNKAAELVDKFYPRATSYSSDRKNQKDNAKKCALIAVDEILKSVPKQPSRSITMPHFEATVYWEEVKQEIEKL
ncbi:hypothetical protein UFOVP514_41 [uncultured Caudovirales phage]|uniref:Uncharacterized protein n=1 Tax=uncultured Caudovirales phage TaxID=2100421 RepID=A0A6J5MRT8_9CAUD|nr:hypothetical protein UFOVP514_41 [uncultured Caudovirales phage]